MERLLVRQPATQPRNRASAVREHDLQAGVVLEDAGADQMCGRDRRLERIADRVPQIEVVHRRQLESARRRVHEHERVGVLGGGPEVAEPFVPEIVALERCGDLDAVEPSVAHQLVQVVGSFDVDGA